MEGHDHCSFRFTNYQNNNHPPSPPPPPPTLALYRATPPFTAIDRFLWGQSHFSHQNNVKNKATLISSNGVSELISPNSSGVIGCYDQESATMQCLPIEKSLLDGFLEPPNWMQVRNYPNVGFDQEEKPDKKNSRGMGRRLKGESFKPLIKGQWTDDEDRKLIRLVKQHGVRKWAQIAERMVGRAGKQCRERWHNHLRPDIKKDTWSEEEELMLVEAHKSVGNKWAEIAKRIPGRTENSIKNHWNATKRRQNSCRKSKKNESQNKKLKPSLLQDYIKSQSSNADISTTTATTTVAVATPTSSTTTTTVVVATPTSSTTTNATSTNSTISDDPSIKFNILYPELSKSNSDDSPSLDDHTYYDELNFMLSFFSNNSNDQPHVQSNPLGFANGNAVETDHLDLCYASNVVKEDAPKSNHLCSDLYLSYLFDGATCNPNFPNTTEYNSSYHGDMRMGDFMLDASAQGSSPSSGKKEMDLMEMVASSQFSSQGISNNSSFAI